MSKQMVTRGTAAIASAVLVSLSVGCANQNHDNSPTPPAAAPAAAPAGGKSFGEPLKMKADEAVPVASVLNHVDHYQGKYVRVSGTVSKVCERKGCWLQMNDPAASDKTLFVKFTCPVDGRLIPAEALGKPVVVEGTLQVKEISEADARHIKEESGASKEEVERIKGPQKQITFASPGAQVMM